MNTALIEQVANQWVADYTISFLNDGDGAVLAQQRRWCAWLQRQRDVLAQRFQGKCQNSEGSLILHFCRYRHREEQKEGG
jgi:hypothetical protein